MDHFFAQQLQPLSLSSQTVRLLLAVLLGGVIGLERQWFGNAAGMRTHILVCVGSALITMVSIEVSAGVGGTGKGDPGHIAAQIVSGVGFLGAGAIMREGITVRGLTTAASVWATAGIGMALGAGPALAALAIVAALIVLASLTLLVRIEEQLKLVNTTRILEIEVSESNDGPTRILDLLKDCNVQVSGVQSDTGRARLDDPSVGITRHLRMNIRLPNSFDQTTLNAKLLQEKGVVSFHFN